MPLILSSEINKHKIIFLFYLLKYDNYSILAYKKGNIHEILQILINVNMYSSMYSYKRV